MLQCQIYARSKETRREHQTADLHLEARIRPRVLVHNEAPDVASHLAEYAEPDGEHECPCSCPCSDDELRDEDEAEERGEEGIGTQVRVVAVERRADGTVWCHGSTDVVVGVVWHAGGGRKLYLKYRVLVDNRQLMK